MSTNEKHDMENQDLNTSQEVKTESKEASETLSPEYNEDLSFLSEDTVQESVEPTNEQRPNDAVKPEHEGLVGSNFWTEDGDWKSTVIGETPNGNKLQVMKRPDGVGYTCNWQSGGVVPAEVDGWFTSYDKAEQAARAYLNRIWEEAE